uniref:Transcription factor CBF/NF-Y/archaeal histone domain-containing protein n=1 Tax=Panagrolaimus sp. PS1159 TaxID=55785 RepID=A0AC35FC67_9BILA
MRTLIKSRYPELCIEEDALIGLTKATELLVQELASGAAKQTKKNIVKYEDVANFVANDKRWGIAVLQEVLPPQRTFADIKNIVFNKKIEEEDNK